ncbi:MAG: amidohydrolase family protein [Caulobacteraceae bacterium]
MRIDAHQHFWRIERGDYDWLVSGAHRSICRDFGPDDLAPLLAAHAIDASVLIQAAPTSAETAFLLDLADRGPTVAAVVGWTDFAAPSAAAEIEALAGRPKLAGLRPMLQDLSDDTWILRPDVGPALDALEATGLCLEALVKPRHLPHLLRLLESRPSLRVAIDHAAKPDIAGGAIEPWAKWMRRIGRETAAICKLSGLASEAGSRWTGEALRPYVEVLLEAFGPSRLAWGSDWPVVNEVGGYHEWIAAAEALVDGLSAADQALVFGGVAAGFYGIEE